MARVVVDVMPKAELLDPQGKVVAGALNRLGIDGFAGVRIGKRFELTVEGEVEVSITTNVGDIDAVLDADTTPCTVNSFVSLADQGYFDGTECHRLTIAPSTIFVLQCGDPTATGTGGPGYTIPDELSGEETYPAGTLAMAKTPYPDSGGSQFFMVYEDTPLPPNYTVFGTVDPEGVEVLREIAEKGTANGGPDGPPTETVELESVTAG